MVTDRAKKGGEKLSVLPLPFPMFTVVLVILIFNAPQNSLSAVTVGVVAPRYTKTASTQE